MKKRKDNVDLICNVSELSALFDKTVKLEEFLQQIVEMIAAHMHASVCSVYLYNQTKNELILSATVGLKSESVGSVRLKMGEGIAGTALKELRPILEEKGSNNPHFIFIPYIGEEDYQAFLAVPLLRGLERLGVIVLQHKQAGYFEENDVKAIKAIAAQLSTTIENAQLLLYLHDSPEQPAKEDFPQVEDFFKGTPASDGVAQGTITKVNIRSQELLPHFHSEKKYTLEDFKRAVKKTEAQLLTLQEEMEENLYDVASLIFSTHLLMIKDSLFSGSMEDKISNGTPPQKAISEVVNEYVDIFSKSTDTRLNEKVQDIRDLGHRLLSNLGNGDSTSSDYTGHIVICGDLLPSDLIKLTTQKAAGIIIVGGTITTHLSILAGSLSVPVIFTNDLRLLNVAENTPALIDGFQGLISLYPSEKVLHQYQSLLNARKDIRVSDQTLTRDKQSIQLFANVNLLSELPLVNERNADGIGLYRSEFPFIIRNTFPSEEEQYRIYRRIFEQMGDKEVTLRTLDVGGDKMLSYYSHINEANPFLGLRAIRFSLRNQDIFTQQLRAMLRAGYGHKMKIMFPLISSVDDYLFAKQIVKNCIAELETENTDHHQHPKIGIMIEIPSAAEIAGDLASHADFVSIGTNDLIQYILGVDRTNEQIADLYIPYHPAVIRTLKRIVDQVKRFDRSPTVCGEMATDEKMLPFLLGIGIRRFSISPQFIPKVQARIAMIDLNEAKALADKIIELEQIKDIAQLLGVETTDTYA